MQGGDIKITGYKESGRRCNFFKVIFRRVLELGGSRGFWGKILSKKSRIHFSPRKDFFRNRQSILAADISN